MLPIAEGRRGGPAGRTAARCRRLLTALAVWGAKAMPLLQGLLLPGQTTAGLAGAALLVVVLACLAGVRRAFAWEPAVVCRV
jgi:hypothetical protein